MTTPCRSCVRTEMLGQQTSGEGCFFSVQLPAVVKPSLDVARRGFNNGTGFVTVFGELFDDMTLLEGSFVMTDVVSPKEL